MLPCSSFAISSTELYTPGIAHDATAADHTTCNAHKGYHILNNRGECKASYHVRRSQIVQESRRIAVASGGRDSDVDDATCLFIRLLKRDITDILTNTRLQNLDVHQHSI